MSRIDFAPSDGLRKAFHAGMPFEDFSKAYQEELADKDLASLRGEDVLLLTAARHRPNHADVLQDLLDP